MLTIHVCIGSACHLKGSYNVINKLQELINENNISHKVTVKAAFCLGECTKAVSVKINDGEVISVNEKNLVEFFNENVLSQLK